MAAPASTDEFVDLVRKSGVVEDKRLDSFVQHLRGSAMPDNPAKLAVQMVQDGLLTHFQAEQIMLGKWRRFTIGKYKVLERLGSGGMGSVYLCEHKFMRRRVAVKVLPAAKAEDQASLERFYREARAAAALDHPNIVRAYDIDQDENLHFLVMEYVDGASLHEIVKKFGPMNILFTCHYVRQAAIGLQHAHEAGLVHRDIKPGNLLVDRSGTLKVLDMGLARFFHDEEDILTKKYDESVLGTADYLAPEQALDSHSVDIRADIYSLGATFYYCLTASPPFNEGTVAQKLIWHQTRQPKAVRSIRGEVPEAVIAVIDRMMTKDRAKRYQTPAQVVDALAGLTAKPILPPPDAWMPRLSPAAMGGFGDAAASASVATPTPAALPHAQPRPPMATPAPGRPSPSAPMAIPARPIAQPQPQPVRQAVVAPPRPVAQPVAAQPVAAQPVAQQRAQPANGVFAQPVEPAPNWGEVAGAATSPHVAAARRQATQASTSSRSSLKAPAVPVSERFQALVAAVKRRPKLWLMVGGGAAGLFLLLLITIVILAFVFSRGGGGKPSTPQQPTRKLAVSSSPEKGEFRTIKDALAKAVSGDHIVVMDETIDEMLNLQMLGKSVRDVTIEGDSNLPKPVVWRPPPPVKEGQQSAQLVSLHDCDGLTFKGFDIHGQNGSHQILDLVIIFGRCPGLKLENIHLQGFKRSAVKLMNCTGESSRPIVLRDLQTSAAPPEASALILEVGKNWTLTSMQHIRIEDCLFEGPAKSSIQLTVDTSCQMANVEFTRNRFYRATDGVFCKRPAAKPYPPVSFVLDSNTFFGTERGLNFETMPLDDPAKPNPMSKVAIKNNLFIQTKTLAQAEELDSAVADRVFPPEAGNVRDGSSQEGNVNLRSAVADCGSVITDLADRSKVLRYPKDSPLNHAGCDKGPVGVPPLD
jgi:serine/threonine protein kinase